MNNRVDTMDMEIVGTTAGPSAPFHDGQNPGNIAAFSVFGSPCPDMIPRSQGTLSSQQQQQQTPMTCNSADSDVIQQGILSVTELDRLQRQRREEADRRLAEENADAAREAMRGIANRITADLEHESFNHQPWNNSRHQDTTTRRMPRLRIRPQALKSPVETLIIPSNNNKNDIECEFGEFGTVFPSPQSDRFVLCLPDESDIPNELLQCTVEESSDAQFDSESDITLQQPDMEHVERLMSPKPYEDSGYNMSAVPSPASTSVASYSPMKSYNRAAKKKISLRPKRSAAPDMQEADSLSPTSSFSLGDESSSIGCPPTLSTACVNQTHPPSMDITNNSLSLLQNGARSMNLKPRIVSSVENNNNNNIDSEEVEDLVMELDPRICLSQDSYENPHPVGFYASPQDPAPTPSPGKRAANYQIEMAKEAAARFGGMMKRTRNSSFGSAIGDSFSPSNLSESNYRTPRQESTFGRPRYQVRGLQNGGRDPELDKHGEAGLLLPSLFSATSDDRGENGVDNNTPKTRSSSFLSLMMETFSPKK